jgi:hypothetical protein
MAISIDPATRVITIPQADLTSLGGDVYELNVNQFRLWLKDYEDNETGMYLLDTHRHNTEVTVGGVTLARVIEIINGYTVTFEDGAYAVTLTGGNNNLADVMNVNNVSLRSNNSAGLVVAEGTSPDDLVNAMLTANIETDLSFDEILRLIAAAMFGKVSGAGTSNIVFRDTNDTKNRIEADVDVSGNRISVTLDPD